MALPALVHVVALLADPALVAYVAVPALDDVVALVALTLLVHDVALATTDVPFTTLAKSLLSYL